MNVAAVLKILAVLSMDTAIAYLLTQSVEFTIVAVSVMMLYAFAGEYIDLIRDNAIRAEKCSLADRTKLENAKEFLAEELQESGIDISGIQFHLIPDNNVNAYAYGMKNIGVTKACLQSTDCATLNAVLAHEISHTRNLDAVFNRIAFANVTALLIGLGGFFGILAAALWMIIALPSLFSSGGCAGIMAARGISNLLGSIKNFLQHIMVVVYQAAMGLISRRCEYRADRFAAEIGYGPQLSYFLERLPEDAGRATLRELLYATHPHPQKRIARLEQYHRTQLELQNVCL